MASRTGILVAALFFQAILPLLAFQNLGQNLGQHLGQHFLPIPGIPQIEGGIVIDPLHSPWKHHQPQNTGQEPGIEDTPPPGSEPVPRQHAGQEPGTGATPSVPVPGPEENPEQGPGGGATPTLPKPGKGVLKEGFYQQSCPQAEKIVNDTVHKHFSRDPTFAPALVRLFFHDCFVTGCDASLLLDKTPTGEDVEKKAHQNGKFVRGFKVIDDIKSQLEAQCPGVVSCADILAFANRDSLVFTGVPSYNVAAGRRDGLASLAKNVDLPEAEATAEYNIQLFAKKGLSLEELVVLDGAHSIGAAHCSIISERFHDPEKAKEIDRGYLIKMQTLAICESDSQDVPFDPLSQQKMDSRFYKELLTKQALLESDHNLAKEPRANAIMKYLVNNQNGWLAKFTNAIKKMGEIEVLTGNQGEIRKQCRAVN